jgi:iron complex transport system ATP-binding protein
MKLEARSITASVKGRTIVSNAALDVAPGELVGLIGPNGAGKSTLLKALLGIRPRDRGGVTIGGDDFFTLPTRERARRVAFLPQERHVEWRLAAYDVVMLGRYPHHSGFGGYTAEDRAAVDRAIAAVDGQQLVDRPVTVLSGGERTRILLARALAVEAPILLVDEPIAALDPYHQLHVMEILQGLSRAGSGVLAVIHDLSLASRFMDRLVLMNEGAIIANGKPADVLTPDLLASAYGVEAMSGSHNGASYVLPWSRTAASKPA